jgi:hypothetical protein
LPSGFASGTTVVIWQAQNRGQSGALLKNVLVDNSLSWSVDMTATDTLSVVVHNTGSAESNVTVTACGACGSFVSVPFSGTATYATLTVSKCRGDAGAGRWTAYVGCP